MNLSRRLEGQRHEVQHQRRIPTKQVVHGFKQVSLGENYGAAYGDIASHF